MTTPRQSIPASLCQVLVTGDYFDPQGNPLSGSVTFCPPTKITAKNVPGFMACCVTVPLVNGRLSVTLVAGDDPNLNPTGWTYQVQENITCRSATPYAIALSCSKAQVDLTELAPSVPNPGNWVPVPGPKGDPGPVGPAGDPAAIVVNGHHGPTIDLVAGDVHAVPDTATASGDVTGTIGGALTLAKMQGTTVTMGTPTDGQVLAYSASAAAVEPTTLTAGSVHAIPAGAAASGDLVGQLDGPLTVHSVQGVKVTMSAPTDRQVLVYSAGTTDFHPGNLTAGDVHAVPDTATASGDVTGTLGGPLTVAEVQGTKITMGTPTDGQVLAYSAGAGAVEPATLTAASVHAVPDTATASGDVTGTIGGALTLAKMQGTTLTMGTPTNGQVLAYSSSAAAVEPTTLTAASVHAVPDTATATGDVTGTIGGPLAVAKVQGTTFTMGSPTNGQVLAYSASAGAVEPATLTAASVHAVPDTATASGDVTGTIGGALTLAKMQGTTLTMGTPTDGQVLAYSASAGAVGPTTLTAASVHALPNTATATGDVTGTLGGPLTVGALQGVKVGAGTPADGDVLTYASTAGQFEWSSKPPAKGWTKPRRLLIYYGIPNGLNQRFDDNYAGQFLSQYDVIVLGPHLADPANANYADTKTIMQTVIRINPQVQFFGYVDIGGNSPDGGTTPAPTIPQIEQQIDQWAALGVLIGSNVGVFMDRYGYDFQTTRDRQNTCVDYAHAKTPRVDAFANAFTIDDALSSAVNPTMNPGGTATHLGDGDWYLLESWVFNEEAAGQPGFQDGYQPMASIRSRGDAAQTYRAQLKVKMAGVGIVDYAAHPPATDGTIAPVVIKAHHMTEVAGMIFGLDAFGTSAATYSSFGPNVNLLQPVPYWRGLPPNWPVTEPHTSPTGHFEIVERNDLGLTLTVDQSTNPGNYAYTARPVDWV